MADPLLVGIEIGGTKLQIGLGHGDGRLIKLDRRQVDPALGAEGIRAQIREAIASLGAKIDAVGIGFGGPVDTTAGRVTVSNQIEGWAGFPLVEWVRETTGIDRIALQNDADTAALGEARFGAGVGFSPVLYVTVGSGIGGGLVVDGAIYRGGGLGAVEIGHLWVGETTLEGIASGWSIGREASRRAKGGVLLDLAGGDPARITAEMVGRAAAAGDAVALAVLDWATEAMGRALASVVTLLAPRRVILGGGVSLIEEDLWLAPIRRETQRRVFPPFQSLYEIVPAGLGEEVVVHGALALARDQAGSPGGGVRFPRPAGP